MVLSEFRLTNESTELVLLLLAVTPLESQPGAPRAEPFSLEFVGPANPRLDQGTYSMTHQDLGAIDIFIVPIGVANGGGVRYEAVFN
jgi:hypothetical protein